ncbi:MAG: ANTAR domain-containing protein [Knoellia sp.]
MTSQATDGARSPTASVGGAVEARRTAVSVGGAEAAFVEVGRVAQQVGPIDATAALTVVDEHGARNVWSSDRSAARLDAVQYRAHGGPSPKAAAGSSWESVPIGDLVGARACPALTVEAGQDGVGSLLAVSLAFYAPMLVLPRHGQRASYGSLTLYAAGPDAFSRAVIDTVLAVTGNVALALMAKARIEVVERSRQDLAEQLYEGLESRLVIGRAQGVLMERYQVSPAQAYALLYRASLSSDRMVLDLAEEVVGSTDGGVIRSSVFEREDLRSAHSRLMAMGITLQALTAAGGQFGHTPHLGTDQSEMQVSSGQDGH